LINQTISDERVIAFDSCCILKAGKSTYGRGKYWSGVAGTAKCGLDICGFAVVEIVNNTAFHLKTWQTPSADELAENGLDLFAHHASLVTENVEQFKAFSKYMAADVYFSQRPIINAVKSSDLDFINLLRNDNVLKNKFVCERTCKKGAPIKLAGLCAPRGVHLFKLNTDKDERALQPIGRSG